MEILATAVLLEQPIASGATRAEVMALATAALEDPAYTLDGKLAQMVKGLPAMWETQVRSLG